MMNQKRFFIVGAARSGTTSLCYYLSQHSKIFLPSVKEPRYFAYAPDRPKFTGPGDEASVNERSVIDADSYDRLFDEAADDQWKGDGSTVYLYWPDSAKRIKEAYPDARIIAILRDPAERALSMYRHKRKQGLDPLEFAEALDAEEERIEQGWSPAWHYQKMGFYGRQLEEYFRVFPKKQILVLHFERLKADAKSVTNRICGFLNLPVEAFVDTKKIINQTGTKGIVQRLFGKRSEKLSDIDSLRLNKLYREDTEKLHRLIGDKIEV